MTKEWLKNKISVDEAEQKHVVKDDRLGTEPIPFGFQYKEWLAFKKKIQDGDEIWKFSSPPETWEHLRGRAGICIVRDNKIVAHIVTLMN